jgi:hypothetical protein
VLQVIADFTGLNIITSDTVTGQSDACGLKDVPWDQGAGHHSPGQRPRHAQDRQRGVDRAA